MKEELTKFLSHLAAKGVWIEEMKVDNGFLRLLQEDIYQTDAANFDKHFYPMYPNNTGDIIFYWANKKIRIKVPEKKLAYYWVQVSHDSAIKAIYREGTQPEDSTFIRYIEKEAKV